ncbi:hypothetical protein BD410DRAFT_793117 [Rickenella mellea]|uniref:Uncharacterized protein n=1 Tax=Rickenella mellea TaxID=50990 RepID=A0A4Y7PVG2_9AGAM|nr:hypothetical protein BD410DRAFT_793117 [Rickenella mellea]
MNSRLSIGIPRWPFKRRQGDTRPKNCYTERLTPDILHQIFVESLPKSPYPSLHEAPLNVSQVCQSWRKMVLGSPLLWSEIHVGSFISPNVSFPGHARHLEEWIKRSGDCPLSLGILFKGSENPDPAMVTDVDAVIGKILPHVQRWRRIHLFIPAACRTPFLQALSTGAPYLDELLMNFDMTSMWHPLQADVSLCPQLSKLTLPPDVRFLCDNPVILHRVQVLHLSFTSMDDCFHCLDSCPSIEEINFVLFSNYVDFSTCIGQSVRHLPNLQHMKVHGGVKGSNRHYTNHPRNNIGLFFDCLRVPSLTSLEIIQPWANQVPHWNHLSSLFVRSQPRSSLSNSHSSVEELTMSGSQMDERQFVDTLGYLPHLKHLLVDGCLVTAFTMGALIAPLDTPSSTDSPGSTGIKAESHHWLCPRLSRIGIRRDASEESYKAMARLVAQRWPLKSPSRQVGKEREERESLPGPARITSIVIDQKDKYEVVLHMGIKECVEEGLEVLDHNLEPIHNAKRLATIFNAQRRQRGTN